MPLWLNLVNNYSLKINRKNFFSHSEVSTFAVQLIIKTITTMARTFAQIARDIKAEWKKPYFGAVPWLNALAHIESSNPYEAYYCEDAKSVAQYFLANASTFRGEKARQLKQELKELIK